MNQPVVLPIVCSFSALQAGVQPTVVALGNLAWAIASLPGALGQSSLQRVDIMVLHSQHTTVEWSLSDEADRLDIRIVPIDCHGVYGNWTLCTANCGGGTRQRMYTVITPASSGGLSSTCAATDGEVVTEACNILPCPIDCEGFWGAWGSCDQQCGAGVQSRQFAVTVEAAYGGTNGTCVAEAGSVEMQACNTQPCPVNCTGHWSQWDICNASCGGGAQSRYYTITQLPMHGGSNSTCETADGDVQTSVCNTQPCAVQCVGEWSDWGACSQSCGGGNRTRQFAV
eukprot:SAG31_NODE_2310_length_5960_cov_5.846613_6_plen_283_part_01